VPDRSPFALAALACAAVRGLQPVAAAPLDQPDRDVDGARITDDLGRDWLVRAPRGPAAAARLDQEVRLLAELTGWLPFPLPQIAGTAELPEGGDAVLHRVLPGTPLSVAALTPEAGLTAAVGRAIAAVHGLPERLIEEAGLPVYTAQDHRQRRLAEVDRAAATGQVPVALLERWEKALEEPGAWRFAPCVVHGDLAEENVLVDGDDVVGLTGWGEARVADPADDLAWLVASCSDDVVTAVLTAYARERLDTPDPQLPRRARLAGELAVTRWLLHGVASDDTVIVDDAVVMLRELEQDVAGNTW
jgi:macrolide phosphotransferase